MTTYTSDDITYRATASRPSTCLDRTEHPSAVDVDIVATLPHGVSIEGEVTLVASEYDDTLEPYGPAPDYWISGGLLRALTDLGLSDTDYRDTLRVLASVAGTHARRG